MEEIETMEESRGGSIRFYQMADIGTQDIEASLKIRRSELPELLKQVQRAFMLQGIKYSSDTGLAELRFTPGNGMARVFIPDEIKPIEMEGDTLPGPHEPKGGE